MFNHFLQSRSSSQAAVTCKDKQHNHLCFSLPAPFLKLFLLLSMIAYDLALIQVSCPTVLLPFSCLLPGSFLGDEGRARGKKREGLDSV